MVIAATAETFVRGIFTRQSYVHPAHVNSSPGLPARAALFQLILLLVVLFSDYRVSISRFRDFFTIWQSQR